MTLEGTNPIRKKCNIQFFLPTLLKRYGRDVILEYMLSTRKPLYHFPATTPAAIVQVYVYMVDVGLQLSYGTLRVWCNRFRIDPDK